MIYMQFLLVFFLFTYIYIIKGSAPNSTMCVLGKGFPTLASNAGTPAKCPTIQLNSDMRTFGVMQEIPLRRQKVELRTTEYNAVKGDLSWVRIRA